MDNVVYILGAGFSAPLGLPVISNFISKAHDIFQDHRDLYPNFEDVFKSIKNRLASIALVYKADLDNIEEVLSILEMERLAGEISSKETSDFNKFIIDVIKYFTPAFVGPETVKVNSKYICESAKYLRENDFQDDLFSNYQYRNYGNFVLKLFNTHLSVTGIETEEDDLKQQQDKVFKSFKVELEKMTEVQAKYSVISLNYDLVLENLAGYYSSMLNVGKIEFARPQTKLKNDFPVLAKLHGSIDTNTIIPPTWNKTIKEKIDLEWKAAHQALASANHIRFIGYSLPEGDAYIKYLLKSSVIESENLKRVDVICLDPTAEVQAKYDNFISEQSERKYRFANGNTTGYLANIYDHGIEYGHEAFFNHQKRIG